MADEEEAVQASPHPLSDQAEAALAQGVHRDQDAEQDDDTAFQSPAGETAPLEHMAPVVAPDAPEEAPETPAEPEEEGTDA